MKTLFTSFFILSFFLLSNPLDSQACIDPGPDTTVRIIITYDTNKAPCIEEVEVRITNLRLMTENPGKICACALDAWNSLIGNVVYIAFVDSGTNNPYLGFAAWNANAASSLAWKNSQPNYDWEGFLANVIGSGLSATTPVELVIRLRAPMGQKYTLNGDSALSARSVRTDVEGTTMGTDAWDDSNNDLMEDHQGIYSFDSNKPGNSVSYVAQDASYFQQLDNDILNNIPNGLPVLAELHNGVAIYPIPTEGDLNIQIASNSGLVQVNIYSLLGKLKYSQQILQSQNGKKLIIPKGTLEAGVYLVQVNLDSEIFTQRIVIK